MEMDSSMGISEHFERIEDILTPEQAWSRYFHSNDFTAALYVRFGENKDKDIPEIEWWTIYRKLRKELEEECRKQDIGSFYGYYVRSDGMVEVEYIE